MNHVRHAFGETADLYQVLGLESRDDAEHPAKLRKAYFRQALVYHPDKTKVEDAAVAKEKFQAISFAYQVLKDPERRAEYNDTGHVDDDGDDNDDNESSGTKNWKDYFDRIFGKVTTSKIDQFALKYKCSDEEQRDVLKEYRRWKGDLGRMLDYVMLSEILDAKRWVEDYLTPAIEAGVDVNGDAVPDHTKTLQKTMKKLEAKMEKVQQKKKPQKTQSQSSKKKTAKATTTKKPKSDSKKENKKPVESDDDDDDDENYDDDDMSEGEDDVDDDDVTETESDDEDVSASKTKTKKKNPAGTTNNKKKKVTATKAKPTKTKAAKKTTKKTTKDDTNKDDLVAMIQANHAKRSGAGAMFASLGARYGVQMDDDEDDPLGDDAEFEKIQARILKGGKKKRTR